MPSWRDGRRLALRRSLSDVFIERTTNEETIRMELVMIFDMRAPAFGAPREDLYAAALDMAAWADDAGFDVIGFGEHHGAEDGYNPSPLVLAAAMAARTRQIRLRTAVLLASCYDPIRLAEDLAVLQILSRGRFELGLGFGYRPSEFAMYGRDVADRLHTRNRQGAQAGLDRRRL